ncbi:MAG TPA: hypothetical protein PLQ45_00725 [Anaerohalosphaeraceae bacterium]|jgi:hypothetical protein|nr:hypothetical protein [Anaerohalosphaeraceae bacterium]
MKKGLILWILATVCGCTGYQVSRVPQPKGTYIPAIYAAGQIAHGPTRSQAFRDLAYHKDMTEGELEYMISLLAIRKGTSQQLKDILLTILNNPAATAQTKLRISGVLPNLDMLPLDQKEIVDALARQKTKNQTLEIMEDALPQ